MAKEEEPKKLIIDEDWKTQAQKEKEVLKKQEEQEHKEPGREERGYPPADLSALVSMLATQAYLALGVLGAEEDEQREPDLAAAKFNIDLLAMIQEKTRGNSTEEEQRLLAGALHQLRMVFVEMSK